MTQIQDEREFLMCTHKDCRRPQTEDGEFCDLHYPGTIEQVEMMIEELCELREVFCQIENKREPVGKSILAIDRIDTLLTELKTTWK